MALSISLSASAALTKSEAEQHVMDLVDSAISAAKARQENFSTLFHRYFDSAYIGRFILGKYWNHATPAQQTDYLQLFNKLVISSYEKRFDDYSGETVTLLGTHTAGKDFIVKSTLSDSNKQPIKINWRVRERPQGPRIIDIVVEDISLSVTQRSEYASIIQQNNNNIEALLQAMQDKINRLAKQAAFNIPNNASTVPNQSSRTY